VELNAAFGAGAARKAKVSAEIEQEEGTMKLKFQVKESGIGMNLEASAEASMNIDNRVISDPAGLAVPAATAKAKITSASNRLQFKSG
jgi:hypothetical protein